MNICRAKFEHLDKIASLFNQYRVFYNASVDIDNANAFIRERLERKDSVIFVVADNENILGFCQLYASFSSISMRTIWILNDLFVHEHYRNKGLATLLLNEAERFAYNDGAIRIILSTQISNTTAQKLYEKRGYIKDQEFYHYELSLSKIK